MNKAVVIGSNSFSGSSFIKYLLKKNFKVIGISRSSQKKDFFCLHDKKHKNFIFKKLDINKDIKKIIKIIKKNKVDFVINYSSQSMVGQSWNSPQDWFMTNSYSIPYLYNEISKIKKIKLVHISTPEVYGNTLKKVLENHPFNPSTPYAVSRCTADNFLRILVQQKKIKFVGVRAANVYGEGQDGYRIIPKTVINLNKGIPLELHGGGKSIRSFIHIDDVSDATFKAMKSGRNGHFYHISNNHYIKIKDLVKQICKTLKISFKHNIKNTKDRAGKDFFYKMSSSKIRKELKWRPKINLNEGIKRVLNWYQVNKKKINLTDTLYKHKK